MAKKNQENVEATEMDSVDYENDVEVSDVNGNGERSLNADGTERVRRGESMNSRVRSAFAEIMGEYTSSGAVDKSTLDDFIDLFHELPTGIGIPYAVQLENIKLVLAEKATDPEFILSDECQKLIQRKKYLNSKVNPKQEKVEA